MDSAATLTTPIRVGVGIFRADFTVHRDLSWRATGPRARNECSQAHWVIYSWRGQSGAGQ